MFSFFKNSKKEKDPKKKDKKNEAKKNSPPSFLRQFGTTIIVVIIFVVGLSLMKDDTKKADKNITMTQLVEMIEADTVETIVVKGDKIIVELADETTKITTKERGTNIAENLTLLGVSTETLRTTNIEVKGDMGAWQIIMQILNVLVPIIIVLVIVWFFYSQTKGGGMKALSFGQSKAKMTDPNKIGVTFNDVAGNQNAKEELKEIVDFLRFPKKYFDMGAKIPKGVLLTGVPGTGKTLLARAVAGEAKAPFFHLSGSEFVEMFVGVGASRVRDLFEQAKAAAPAIVFIDEIDAVGRHRGAGVGGGNDEREQTLNQILVEMDGFDPNQQVIVMAATNRSDVLDKALTRPGRFDRRVILDLPDRKDRRAILDIHAKGKPFAKDVDLDTIATRTPGFSGADLASLMNESALWAARHNKKEINQGDILTSIEKVMIGPERKSHVHTLAERELTAYHEAGHAIVASALEHCDPVHKISIIARGHAGGYTLKLPELDRKLSFRQTYLDDIAMSLGGYVAEMMMYGDVTTGPSNDLQVATKLAHTMVTKWGMSDKIGAMALLGNNGQTMFGSNGVDQNQHSDRQEQLIDDEVSRIMTEAKVRAEKVLKEYEPALEAVKVALLEQESLEQAEYEKIIEKHGLKVVHKKESEIKKMKEVKKKKA